METTPWVKNEDVVLDQILRPKSWSEYVGQEKIKQNLKILIEAAKKRSEPIEHVLLYGPAGLGKTTLAHLIARELGSTIKITSGPAIEKVGDLAAILTNLSAGDILFIDEAHRLNKLIEEILYPAMESRMLDIVVGKGPSARTLQLQLPPFTLIAATTRIGMLSSPLRSRFGVTFRLNFYEQKDVEQIVEHSAKTLNVTLAKSAVEEIAKRSRFTPRVANRLLKRVRDYAQVKEVDQIDSGVSRKALELLEIDESGLEPTDRRLLETIITKFDGGPVGLQSLAAATSEEESTIADIYEPFLLQLGLIARTGRGRIATKLAYKHLGVSHQKDDSSQTSLL
ncbi:Holliday junction branch migration DNA helicase RuvB [Candidatus Parcubacteria bacterium]|nr:MAG: Holliday junction branch migration DNA helicase RuvB [Candidatus Parcubacteria bacterium]